MKRFLASAGIVIASATALVGMAAAPAAATQAPTTQAPTTQAPATRLTATGDVPADCSVSVASDYRTTTMTCTSRPAGERWYVNVACVSMRGLEWIAKGNVVTGNGTSVAYCVRGIAYAENAFYLNP